MKAAASAAAVAVAKAPAMTGTTTAQCTTTADVSSSEADDEAEAIDHTNEQDLDDDQEGFEEDNNVKRYNDEGTTPAVNSERNSFVSSDDLSLSEDENTKVNYLNELLNK